LPAVFSSMMQVSIASGRAILRVRDAIIAVIRLHQGGRT
jgi:hypothetical protein